MVSPTEEATMARKPFTVRIDDEEAELLAAGARDAVARGARCRSLEVVLDELEATKLALDRANPGDLVVLCADQVDAIVDELQSRSRS